MKHLIYACTLMGMTLTYAPLAAADKTTESTGQESPETTAYQAKSYAQDPAIRDVNSASFTQMLSSSKKPMVLIFTAEWCGPCKKLKPILEEIAAHTPDVVFVRANFDSSRDLAANYGVGSIPTLIYFQPGGRVVDTSVGYLSKQEVMSRIQNLISTSKNR